MIQTENDHRPLDHNNHDFETLFTAFLNLHLPQLKLYLNIKHFYRILKLYLPHF
jgi:hypothetical protein